MYFFAQLILNYIQNIKKEFYRSN